MKKLKKLEKTVYSILKANLVCRGDDFILYDKVLEQLGVDRSMPFATVLNNHIFLNLPSFESVSRVRRHIQELEPELKNSKVAVLREEAETDYKLYNLSGVEQ